MAQRCALSAVRCLMGLVIPDEFDPFAEKGSQTKAPGDGEAQFRAAGGRLAEALLLGTEKPGLNVFDGCAPCKGGTF